MKWVSKEEGECEDIKAVRVTKDLPAKGALPVIQGDPVLMDKLEKLDWLANGVSPVDKDPKDREDLKDPQDSRETRAQMAWQDLQVRQVFLERRVTVVNKVYRVRLG